MSCTGDKPCNCQMDTPYTPYEHYVTTTNWTVGNMEKPGEKIKRRVNDFQEQVKIMLNNLIDELGINFGEIEINLNDEGNKIESVYVFWDVEK